MFLPSAGGVEMAMRGDLHFQHSFHLFTFMAPQSAHRQVPDCSKGAHRAHSIFFSSFGLSTIFLTYCNIEDGWLYFYLRSNPRTLMIITLIIS